MVKAPHQKQTCAKLVEQLDLLQNLTFFTLRTDGLCLPNLFINELAVAHSKASISWHFFASPVAVKAPHQTKTCSVFVPRLGLVHNLTLFAWRTVTLFFPNKFFLEFAIFALTNTAFGIVFRSADTWPIVNEEMYE